MPQRAYNRKRLPAYCDRVLWRSLPGHAAALRLVECVAPRALSPPPFLPNVDVTPPPVERSRTLRRVACAALSFFRRSNATLARPIGRPVEHKKRVVPNQVHIGRGGRVVRPQARARYLRALARRAGAAGDARRDRGAISSSDGAARGERCLTSVQRATVTGAVETLVQRQRNVDVSCGM